MEIIHYLHCFIKVYNAFREWCNQLWGDYMAKKTKKTQKTPRMRRVTFYIRPKGSKRRKKVSFFARR
jgi:hypothetical protein